MKKTLLILLMMSFLIPQQPCEGTCLSEEETKNIYNNIQELQFDIEKYLEQVCPDNDISKQRVKDELQAFRKMGFENLLKHHTSEARAKEFIETCERYINRS